MNSTSRGAHHASGEEGYFLVGLVVVCFLLLLALGVAAPRVAKQLEREREVESEHRAQEYVRAIQLYYRKNGRYPTSVDQLTGSSSGNSGLSSVLNVKYLRQAYKDPLTGGEYRLIHFGEAKTEVKGFFGEPLQGLAPSNLGSPAGPVSGTQSSSGFSLNGPGSAIGGAGALNPSNGGTSSGASQGFSLGNTSSAGSGSFGSTGGVTGASATAARGATSTGSPFSATGDASMSASSGTGTAGSGTAPATGSAAPTSGYGSFSSGSTSATSFQGNKGAIVGVASGGKGHGLVEWNGSENIEDWEFLYDPRVEQMKARVSLFGGSPASVGGSLGGGFKAADGSTALGFGQSGTTGGATGTGGSGSGFGSSGGFGSGFGSTGTAASGSSSGGVTGTPSAPVAPSPQAPQQ